MRNELSEQEKNYIKSMIFDPLEKDIPRIILFGTIERGLRALNSSVSQLKFDKKEYEAKFVLEDAGTTNKFNLRLLARKKNCSEVISLDTTISKG
ncbi:MAG: hypothetical protein AABY22_26915 [Nanoarchaeota archaeon]